MGLCRLGCSISINKLKVTVVSQALKQKQDNLLYHLGHQVLKLRTNSANYMKILNMNKSNLTLSLSLCLMRNNLKIQLTGVTASKNMVLVQIKSMMKNRYAVCMCLPLLYLDQEIRLTSLMWDNKN